jgi:hypothetical protein
MRGHVVFAAVALTLSLAPSVAYSAPSAANEQVATALESCAPTTYEAALNCLDSVLPAEMQAQLAAPDGSIEAHFGLGMWIRNNWGLWQQGPLYHSMTDFGLEHPDDMSGAILEGFAARERGESYDVAARAVENRAEATRMWNQAVREGRAGSFQCPASDRSPKKTPTVEQIEAEMTACFDQLTESDQN